MAINHKRKWREKQSESRGKATMQPNIWEGN